MMKVKLSFEPFSLRIAISCLARGVWVAKQGAIRLVASLFLGSFRGSMVIIVLGSAGKEERFHDCMRLAEWVTNKLFLTNQLSLKAVK